MAHAKERFVYQAVHMLFNGDFTEPWESEEERCCKLTFIGKNIDHDALREGFNKCLCTPELNAKRLKKLRFAIGDRVECNTGIGGWGAGSVINLMYRDDSFPPGDVAPYQVQLDDGDLIYAPADVDELIRAAK